MTKWRLVLKERQWSGNIASATYDELKQAYENEIKVVVKAVKEDMGIKLSVETVGVAELVDALDLGSSDLFREGSSPFSHTMINGELFDD